MPNISFLSRPAGLVLAAVLVLIVGITAFSQLGQANVDATLPPKEIVVSALKVLDSVTEVRDLLWDPSEDPRRAELKGIGPAVRHVLSISYREENDILMGKKLHLAKRIEDGSWWYKRFDNTEDVWDPVPR